MPFINVFRNFFSLKIEMDGGEITWMTTKTLFIVYLVDPNIFRLRR